MGRDRKKKRASERKKGEMYALSDVFCPVRPCMPALTKRACIVEAHVTALLTSTVCFKYPKDAPSKPSAELGEWRAISPCAVGLLRAGA